VFADYTGLPPLLIQVGSTEVLYSDAVRVADQAERAGVEHTLQVWEQMPHVFHALAAWLPEASMALREIGVFVNARLGHSDEAAHVRARAQIAGGNSWRSAKG
jgi:acetyl esterase/lipase